MLPPGMRTSVTTWRAVSHDCVVTRPAESMDFDSSMVSGAATWIQAGRSRPGTIVRRVPSAGYSKRRSPRTGTGAVDPERMAAGRWMRVTRPRASNVTVVNRGPAAALAGPNPLSTPAAIARFVWGERIVANRPTAS